MLDSMYQDGTDQVLDDRVARPLQAPTVRPSFGANLWNTTKAPFAGVGAGANESAGMFSDILGAYGAVQAGIGLQADPSLLFDSDAQAKRKQEGQASRDAIQSGEAFSTDIGTGFRAKARSFMPDPATSNVAADVLFGLGRFATKAIGYSVAGGPVAGPVLTAVDEGMTEADKLKAQGVDFATRTKVGAVAGVAAGAAVALPVAGKTLAETAALVAVGGPGAFVSQQAASKAILENAGYDKIAEQYDPFDPVGLIVATLVPAAFGAHAMRSAKAKAKPVIDPEAVDAARVDQVQQQIVESNPYHPADVAGANDHIAAVERAHDQMAAGEPVNVTDIVSAERIDPARGQEFINRVQTAIDDSAVVPDFVTNPAKTSMDKANRMMSDLMADPAIPAPIKTRLQEASLNSLMKSENKAYVAAVSTARKEGNLDTANIDRIHQQMIKPSEPAIPKEQPLKADQKATPTITNNKGEVFHDTRGTGARFHGTSRKIDGLSNEYAMTGDSRNIYGQGFYTTDAADISAGYMRKGGGTGGKLYAVEHNSVKLFDMEADLTPQTREMVKSVMGDLTPVEDINGHPIKNMRALLDEYRAESANEGLSRDTVQEVLDSIRSNLEDQGYRGYQHAGGIVTGNAKHDVKIFWYPEQDVRIKESNIDSFKVPDQGSAGNPTGAALKPPSTSSNQATAAPNAKGEGKAAPSPFEAQTAELARTSPDMMVQLEGMDKPVRLADALEAVKKEAANDVQDANLLQVAADCFLRSA